MEEEKNREVEITLKDLWSVFLHCWWIMLIVGVVITVGLYIFMNATHEDVYTATTTAYVMKESTTTSTGEVSISNALVDDYIYTANLDRVLEKVIYECGLVLEPRQLRKMITISAIEETRFVEISVTAQNPERAAQLSNMLAKKTCETLNNELLHGQNYSSVANESKVPQNPSNPISLLKILLIALLCALVVYVIYLVLFLMDDKINTAEDVEKYLGLNLLGQIPNRQDAGKAKKYYAAYTTTNQK